MSAHTPTRIERLSIVAQHIIKIDSFQDIIKRKIQESLITSNMTIEQKVNLSVTITMLEQMKLELSLMCQQLSRLTDDLTSNSTS